MPGTESFSCVVRTWLVIALSLLCAVAAGEGRAAQAVESLDESQVKALYIYRFIEYVDWRGESEKPASGLVIGVLGADDVARELRQIAAARGSRVRSVLTVKPGEDFSGLHVLYVGRRESGRLAQHVRHTPGILTIGDSANGLEQGAVINLVSVEGKVRFEISLPAAERNGLTLSSRLLAVALRVKKSMLHDDDARGYAGLPSILPALGSLPYVRRIPA